MSLAARDTLEKEKLRRRQDTSSTIEEQLKHIKDTLANSLGD